MLCRCEAGARGNAEKVTTTKNECNEDNSLTCALRQYKVVRLLRKCACMSWYGMTITCN